MKQLNLCKLNQLAGMSLAILLFLTTLHGCYYFLAVLKVSIPEWMVFNSCAPAAIMYLICFVVFMYTKNAVFLVIPLLPLYFFGTMGLFVMSWSHATIFPHITHIIMTLTIVWVLYAVFSNGKYKELGIGMLISMLVFVPLIAVAQWYRQQHLMDLMRIMQGSF